MIPCCGLCPDFPCPMMREFYGESESHEEAYRRMRFLRGEVQGEKNAAENQPV